MIAATLLHELDPETRMAALTEMSRVRAGNGRILVVDFHVGGSKSAKGRLLRGFSVLTELIAGPTHHRHYRGFLAAGGIPEIAGSAGFTIEREKVVAGGNMGLYLLA